MKRWGILLPHLSKGGNMRAIFVMLIAALGILAGCGGSSGGGTVAQPQFTTVATFGFPANYGPEGPLTQGTGGNFFGATAQGGNPSGGTIFELTSGGEVTTLYTFCAETNCADGDVPNGGLIRAADGNFYGTTQSGGSGTGFGLPGAGGTVFKTTPAGKLTSLYSFCSQPNCSDGLFTNRLIQAADGNFYGTTIRGGASPVSQCYGEGCGNVFRITSEGTLTIMYSFCPKANCADGAEPYAALVQGTDGNFYGTTGYGGANGQGTVFKITSGGTLTTLYSFCSQTNCADGSLPMAELVQGTTGNFYGTTSSGGVNASSQCCGTVFTITPDGALTTLYSFCSQTNCTDGDSPSAGLIQGTDGSFYGVTASGGDPKCFTQIVDGTPTSYSCGTVFRITSAGALTTLHTFELTDGDGPAGALLETANGIFYGTTGAGGPGQGNGDGLGGGTVFSLSIGLGP
jgi:uncharacterized repeat protein (TIGR03803 family)